ncbi:thioredoxin family protein [Paludibacter sp. 221]|jgi:small redox-active disulfide protein 2|uniref:thioredoxin family protein n=1 Tax=Paludibacter sp. 221 TaxID=2302939 RepID=UPI0013D14A06|nr:thioredoxin family protein [Paludibacter sp. 221]NDV45531.1 thioredoxin family protein [Paludibacter sp. 221]
MEIKVLGTGCSRCKTLLTTVEQVVSEIGLNATITKVDDILKIMEYNVMGLPALVVDEKVLSTGKTLSKEEVKKLLTQ